MRNYLLLFFVFCCACTKTEDFRPAASSSNVSSASAVKHKRIVLHQGSDQGLYINGTTFQYSPGDTLVLTGKWSYCSMEDFYGNAQNPVVVINQGAQIQLSNGFSVINCRYIKVTGTGTKDKYGFRISTNDNDGAAVTIAGRSSHIEVTNVDIWGKTYGYWIKQDASCVDSLNYPNWVLSDINVHDGRIKNVTQEGMYMGTTDPNGLRGVNCNGRIIYPKPLRLGNIQVHNMIIDSTYRSGIQLSGADQGKNVIYNNTITNSGFEFNSDGQGSGVSLGGYTSATVRNNKITNTYTMGISSLGAGKVIIINNNVQNSGSLAGHSVPGMASIMMDTRPTTPADSTTFTIKNNTLGKNSDVNLRVYETYPTYSKNNIICSNGNITMSIVPGVKWKSCNQ